MVSVLTELSYTISGRTFDVDGAYQRDHGGLEQQNLGRRGDDADHRAAVRKIVETSIFGRLLNNRTVINVIKCCRFARQVEDEELTAEEAREVLLEVAKLDLNPCHVDIGKLAVSYRRLRDTRDPPTTYRTN